MKREELVGACCPNVYPLAALGITAMRLCSIHGPWVLEARARPPELEWRANK